MEIIPADCLKIIQTNGKNKLLQVQLVKDVLLDHPNKYSFGDVITVKPELLPDTDSVSTGRWVPA